MFERKNQNILSEHFNKLVDHSADAGDSDDDFITLKRADHELNEEELPEHDFTSKRKQRLALSKKALAQRGAKGNKLVFDEEGNPHEMYEMKSAEEVFRGEDDAKEAGKRFAEEERGRLKEADVVDRVVAKEKKKEKKRKRKEREREVRSVACIVVSCANLALQENYSSDDEGAAMAPVIDPVEDDGYMSPDFDLPSSSNEEDALPPPKRVKSAKSTLAEEEERALQLLRSRR